MSKWMILSGSGDQMLGTGNKEIFQITDVIVPAAVRMKRKVWKVGIILEIPQRTINFWKMSTVIVPLMTRKFRIVLNTFVKKKEDRIINKNLVKYLEGCCSIGKPCWYIISTLEGKPLKLVHTLQQHFIYWKLCQHMHREVVDTNW